MTGERTALGRTIKLYLAEGTPTGLLAAEIMNWTGKVIVCPRTRLSSLSQREEVRKTGVYLLSGADPESPDKERVYVGEGDNVWDRLKAHEGDEKKDFWTRTVVVISKDDNLTKSHVGYLESRLYALIKEAGRAILDQNQPARPSLPEADIADTDYFLQQLQMVLPVLGFPFTQPKPEIPVGTGEGVSSSPLFCMTCAGARATAREVGDEFMVLKGSTARRKGPSSWHVYRALRDQLLEEGKLVKSDKDESLLVFAEDVPFKSPSAASCVVYANSVSGPATWKLESTGQTYKEWRSEQLGLLDLEA